MRLIDKDALVAEIERIKKEECPIDTYEGRCKLLWFEQFLSSINTLEVKEGDLENSIVCEAKWHDGFLLDYTQEQQDALLEKIGVNVGDKVRVILMKEMDLEKEVANWWKDHYKNLKNDYKFEGYNGHYMDNSTIISLAQHFFELGLKAQKGE